MSNDIPRPDAGGIPFTRYSTYSLDAFAELLKQEQVRLYSVREYLNHEPLEVGTFVAAKKLTKTYENRRKMMSDAIVSLSKLIGQLGTTMLEVSQQYKDHDALNAAKAEDIDKIMKGITPPASIPGIIAPESSSSDSKSKDSSGSKSKGK